MKRKSIMCLLIICLLLTSFPNRAEAATFTTDLSFTGSTASCLVSIKQPGKKITASNDGALARNDTGRQLVRNKNK